MKSAMELLLCGDCCTKHLTIHMRRTRAYRFNAHVRSAGAGITIRFKNTSESVCYVCIGVCMQRGGGVHLHKDRHDPPEDVGVCECFYILRLHAPFFAYVHACLHVRLRVCVRICMRDVHTRVTPSTSRRSARKTAFP